MISRITYADKLDEYVELEDLIPYRLHPRARYRNNCYYWIDYENKWFKVTEVLYDFKGSSTPMLDHVIVTYTDGTSSYICTDLTIYDFRLERDKYEIRNKEIINSEESFAGGEIEYWFFKHHITSFDPEYKEFWKFFDISSGLRIEPNKFYFIRADVVDDVYTNVRFINDPTREKFRKTSIEPETPKVTEVINYNDVKEIDVKKERNRRRKKHESTTKKKTSNLHRRRNKNKKSV
jgi:hypothetical protein